MLVSGRRSDDGGPNDPITQTGRVIVHDHREQALLLQGKHSNVGACSRKRPDSVHIHSCGNGHLWFRFYSESLGKACRSELAMEVNDDEGSLTPRGALRFFASKLAPTGPAAMGHPWPSAAKPASMPVCPLRRTSTRPLDGARKSKARSRSNAKARRPTGRPDFRCISPLP